MPVSASLNGCRGRRRAARERRPGVDLRLTGRGPWPTISGFRFGGVPERSKGTDCKSVGTAFEGSNPSPSTNVFRASGRAATAGPSGSHLPLGEGFEPKQGSTASPGAMPNAATKRGSPWRMNPAPGAAGPAGRARRGCSSMVEPQPSKLMVWVRFPSPAPLN